LEEPRERLTKKFFFSYLSFFYILNFYFILFLYAFVVFLAGMKLGREGNYASCDGG
jgi:hypothetical protein